MKGSSRAELVPGEQVLGLVRQSIFSRPLGLAVAMVWVKLPFFFFFPLLAFGPVGIGIFALTFLSGLVYLWRRWFLWKNSVFLITDRRIIDVAQEGLFRCETTEVSYANIREARVTKPSLWQRVAGLGNVRVRTVQSFAYDLELKGVRNAENVARLIDEVQFIVTSRTTGETFHVKEVPS